MKNTTQFKSFNDYILEFEKNHNLAILNLDIVCDWWGVTKQTMNNYIEQGKFDTIRIQNKNYITTISAVKMLNIWNSRVKTVKDYLEESARKGTRSINYEPIMTLIGLKTTVPADRNEIGEILGEISEQSYNENSIFLSVLVHRKTTGITAPGEGFFDLYRWLTDVKDTNDSINIEKLTDAVIKHYKR